MSGFGSSPGYSGSSGYHGTGGNGGHGNSYTGNANKDPGYSHPMGRSIGFNHGTRNLNDAARAENRRYCRCCCCSCD